MGALLPILGNLLVAVIPSFLKPKGATKGAEVGSAIGGAIGGIIDSTADNAEEVEGSDGITTAPVASSSVWQALVAVASASHWVLYAGLGLLFVAWLCGVVQISFIWLLVRH